MVFFKLMAVLISKNKMALPTVFFFPHFYYEYRSLAVLAEFLGLQRCQGHHSLRIKILIDDFFLGPLKGVTVGLGTDEGKRRQGTGISFLARISSVVLISLP